MALAANTSRLYALFINDSDDTIYMKFGAAGVLNAGIRLNANGGSYEMSAGQGNLYTGAVNAICTSGGKRSYLGDWLRVQTDAGLTGWSAARYIALDGALVP